VGQRARHLRPRLPLPRTAPRRPVARRRAAVAGP
jgi:hypothetical protein